jgi:hypothetical protein
MIHIVVIARRPFIALRSMATDGAASGPTRGHAARAADTRDVLIENKEL